MAVAYIALGSNRGDRTRTLNHAIESLRQLGQLKARSSFYETEPVGFRDQPPFLNAAVSLETDLTPTDLLGELLRIEKQFGRHRDHAQRNGPRTLDLDLLLMGDFVIAGPDLTLPHPALAERRFVLAPLAEIAPGVEHPVLKQTIAQLLNRLPDEGENSASAVRRQETH